MLGRSVKSGVLATGVSRFLREETGVLGEPVSWVIMGSLIFFGDGLGEGLTMVLGRGALLKGVSCDCCEASPAEIEAWELG